MAMVEKNEHLKKKLIFRSWHRGTREADLLIGSFADKYVPTMSDEQLEEYIAIIERSDPDIYNWITQREEAPKELQNSVLDMMIAHRFEGSDRS